MPTRRRERRGPRRAAARPARLPGRGRPAVFVLLRPRRGARCPTPRAARPSVGGVVVDLSTEQAENATHDRRGRAYAAGCRRGPPRSRWPRPTRRASCATSTTATGTRSGCSSSGRRRAGAPPAQIQDPYYAVNKFYDALVKVDGYQSMRITEAAQKVQRSGFPEAYAGPRGGRPGAGLGADRLQPGPVQLRGATTPARPRARRPAATG